MKRLTETICSVSRSGVVVTALAAFLTPAAGAQSIETFVLTVGGDSSGPGCSTYGSHPAVTSFFGGHGIGIPVPGLSPCNIAGDFRSRTAVSGTLADSMALTANWSMNSLTADTQVYAAHGVLAARAHCTYAGITYPAIVKGSEGFGLFRDQLTITSPSVANGQTGWLKVWVTAEGGLSVTNSGTADVEFAYYANNVGPYTLVRCQVNGPSAQPFLTSGTGNGLSGFTLSPGAMSGKGEIDTFFLQFAFGAPLDFRLGLLSYLIPSYTGMFDCDFKARITGMDVYNSQGQALFDFQVTALSGTAYGECGLLPVTYCVAGTSASGCQALLSASGKPSASAPSGFVLSSSAVEGKKIGLFLHGANGRQATPWGTSTSFLCVAPPTKRSFVLIGGGTSGQCDGNFALDYNAQITAKPGQNPGAGAVVQAQLWYRDTQNPASTKTSLSDAIEFFLGP